MDIRAILAKLKKGTAFEDLTDDEKSALLDYDPAAAVNDIESKLRDAVNHADRLKNERNDLKEKFAELQKRMDEADDAKLTDVEKLKKQLDSLSAQFQQAQGDLETERQSHAKTLREHQLDSVQRSVNFDPSLVNDSQARALVAAALADVDLADQALVDAAVATLKRDSEALILAPGGGGGAGTRKTGNAAPNPGGTLTLAEIEKMTPDEFAKREDEIWAAEAAGAIVE